MDSNKKAVNNSNRSNSEDAEWNTPEWVIAKIVEPVIGQIALDPASNKEANNIIDANRYYTKFDDGLTLSWQATTVFCNPPYGSGNKTGKWWDKMWSEYQAGNFVEGMFLANSTTEVKWFQHALGRCPILLFASRLKFWKPDVATRKGRMGSALVYLPPLDEPLGAPLGGSLMSSLYSPLYATPAPTPSYSSAVARFAAVAGDYGTVITAI